MDITPILDRIVSLGIRDRNRLLQGILVLGNTIWQDPVRLLQKILVLENTASEQVKSDTPESLQWELDCQMSLEERETLYKQIIDLDTQERMRLLQGISASIAPEQVKSDIPEYQQNELLRLKDLEDQKTPYGQVALSFATALVNGKFEDAHSLLSPVIKDEWSPELLRDTYEEMVAYFGDLPVNYISISVVDTSLPDDSWVYVEIACDGCAEAITVTIKVEDEKYLIQKIEWGRP